MTKFPSDHIDTLLFDLDGVLWRGATMIEGAKEALSSMMQSGKKLRFVTNNGSLTRAEHAKKIAKRLEIEVNEAQVFSTAHVVAKYLAARLNKATDAVYVLGMDSLLEEIGKEGLECFGGAQCTSIGNGPDVMSEWQLEDNVKAVVVSWHHNLSFGNLSLATRYLRENDALFIATNRDPTMPMPKNQLPGSGSIVAAVEVASGREAVTIGKPHQPIVDVVGEALKCDGIDLDKAVMVGDRDFDIEFGRKLGVRTVLVLSGAMKGDEAWIKDTSKAPSWILDSVADL